MTPNLSRRNFLRSGAVTLLGTAGAATLAQIAEHAKASPPADAEDTGHLMPTVVGEVDHERNGFNPTDILTDFDYGEVSTLENGQTLREFRIAAVEKLLRSRLALSSRRGPTTGASLGRLYAPGKGTGFESTSATPAAIPTPFTFTAFTPLIWTECQGQGQV